MRLRKTSRINWLLIGILSILVCWFTDSPLVHAQKGQNAVMSGTTQAPSYAFVDATPYGLNICKAITQAFTDYSSAGKIVIDARGLSGTALTCATTDTNPWHGTSLASIVLLPAGTITIYNTWILPSDTRLTGDGPTLTAIQAGTGFTTSTDPDIIDMGSTTGSNCGNPVDCQAVVVEHLALVNQNTSATINGIVNCCSQELSYVDDLALSNITGIGVEITGGGGNSGPYSHLTFSGSGTCISINGSPQTRGIHGLTCISSGSSGALVYVDARNNSLEDVYLQGGSAQDGIRIGYNAAAGNNIFLNVRGSGLSSVIHIPNNSNVSDLTFVGITRSSGTNTITDELTSSVSTPLMDTKVGMYLIGEPVQASGFPVGYSRFTTSTSVNFPTWIVGPNVPTNPCVTGSLFSCNSTLGNCVSPTKTLWGCAANAWNLIK
jgi:hypothetical protein